MIHLIHHNNIIVLRSMLLMVEAAAILVAPAVAEVVEEAMVFVIRIDLAMCISYVPNQVTLLCSAFTGLIRPIILPLLVPKLIFILHHFSIFCSYSSTTILPF